MTRAAPPEGISRVALDVPLRRLFDYRIPAGTPAPQPGSRVRVPFGRRTLIGVVVENATESSVPEAKLKPIAALVDAAPVLDAAVLALVRWASDYYHHPIGEAIASALPKALRAGASPIALDVLWRPTPAGCEALAQGRLARSPAQRQLLELLVRHESIRQDALAQQLPRWRPAAAVLRKHGWVRCESVAAHIGAKRAASPPAAAARAPTLTPEQVLAVSHISAALPGFATFVLHGLTGSGKTEVYLQVIQQVLAAGRRALVLVPEIGLTPQLVRRFEERFNSPLAVLHSALSDGERLGAWRTAASGAARIIVGTRSAVFAPVPELGIIVVDEEHDASLKQHEGGFHYSARDLALVRAQRAQVPVVLGSATPSLETLQNVVAGRYRLLSLPRRAGQAQPPRLAVVDLRAHAVTAGLATPVVQAIERHLAAAGQVLVYLNRRGYAPTLLCTACGWVAPCADCDARLTVHQRSGRLRCHHCGADAPLPKRCPQCGFEVRPIGQGTERVEERLRELFAQAPLVRVDRDVVRGQGDMDAAMHSVNSGAARILVGTQMITKGHDFQNMTLVVVLNADQGLFSTDFRAAERLAQTIVQVAGRAGRGSRAGEVLIQTAYPEHPLLQTLMTAGYDGFARAALAEREAAAWPPFSRLAVVRASATSAQDALDFLTAARRLAGAPRAVKLLGPVPAAMARRAGRYHSQLLLESPDRNALQRLLGTWIEQLGELPGAHRVRWALDVDPIDLF
ncbi:MAG TPA: primosomal protein N' [Steroidobacteraceae bacterium]|jgi:primosomal protein N' (replication factor Y)|nr:primosomal protein N' [Steroidobacteraceae bacterium]